MQPLLDKLAIALSGLCVIHCLLTPVVLVLFPMLMAASNVNESLHWLLLTIILPTSLLALFLGHLRYKDKLTLTLGLAGLSQLVVTSLLGFNLLGEMSEELMTMIGSAALIFGHIRNRQACCKDAC
ncbi:MerC domain-containing protein [Nostoc sp. UIC 10630]|uniref:MerC domain-containing protein n=1 Tax=Nostoc sp. UIC 10630 TaxID=2100146 RepID=UPI0013D6ADF3|nr:MerC domain-containing protein [Nostoc sp. UIC 10630]NEU82772.1 MerC domain-containing protein [Nostoc sp. UIC 10630]